MERRMLLAVVMSFMAVTLYSVITGRGCMAPPPPKDPDANGSDEAPVDGDPPPGNGGNVPNGSDPDEPQDPSAPTGPGRQPSAEPIGDHPHKDVPATETVLESDQLVVGFTSKGGAIEFVSLKNHMDTDGKPLELVVPASRWFLMGQTDITHLTPKFSPGDAFRRNLPVGAMRQLNWIQAAGADGEVVYTFTDRQGRIWKKRWVLAAGADRFDIRLFLSVRGEASATGVDVKVLAASGQLVEPREGQDMFGAKQTVYFTSDMDDVPESKELTFGIPARDLAAGGLSPVRLRLLGSRSLYFTTLYFEAGNELDVKRFWATGEQGDLRAGMEETLGRWYAARDRPLMSGGAENGPLTPLGARVKRSVANMQQSWMVITVPVGPESQEVELPFYAGPIDRDTLSQDVYAPIEDMITYTFAPDFVAAALLGIYDLWRSLFGSVGLAVLLMTLTVRGLLMPISIRNQLGMRSYSRKIKKIKPKIDALREKYAKNPQKLREEQMKLYREHGIGFPSGCLMMIFQMPIWFALFSALRREFTLRGAGFLWIDDLSGPDMFIDFGGGGFWIFTSINLLPVLMIILSIIHTRSMPKPQDEQTAQQYRMMRWFPIVFAVILYNYTAALMLYMTLSSAIGILEARIVRAKDEKLADAEGGTGAWVAEG